MQLNLYFKSLVYLVVTGVGGYYLTNIARPSEQKLKELRRVEGGHTESEEKKRNKDLMNAIKKATEGEPIWRMKKD